LIKNLKIKKEWKEQRNLDFAVLFCLFDKIGVLVAGG
jgi:hypothetical protein